MELRTSTKKSKQTTKLLGFSPAASYKQNFLSKELVDLLLLAAVPEMMTLEGEDEAKGMLDMNDISRKAERAQNAEGGWPKKCDSQGFSS